MNFTLKIIAIKSLREIEGYWTVEDYNNILELLGNSDVEDAGPSELRELVEMGLSDLEPHESAEILLRYKFKDSLNKGQILNLSHEMAEDNESEEYPDIALHYPLFNINQLLYKSYNGIFPNAKATRIEIDLSFRGVQQTTVSREVVLKALSCCLGDTNLIKRLFEEQLEGKEPFNDAEKIIWELHDKGGNKYTVITSDYWINEEDVMEFDFSGSIKEFEAPDH